VGFGFRLLGVIDSRTTPAVCRLSGRTSSGVVSFPGLETVLTITERPICRGTRAGAPACGYYAATFEQLFRRLVSSRAVVTETECAATGAAHCRFEIRYPRR